MLLSKTKEFDDIIESASLFLEAPIKYIRKDFYAISILKELVSHDTKFVFKGGTSLSVCQKIINRFSEDIDISYEDEVIPVGNRKRIKQAFISSIEAAGLSISNLENIRSRRVFNRYLCPFSNNDQVIVEWATQTPSFPIEEKSAQTLIGKYLELNDAQDLLDKYDLRPFTVKTVTVERTMVDKIFAICDYHINKKIDRQSRHIYDLRCLLKKVKLDSDLIDLLERVRVYRIKLEACLSAKEGMILSNILFDLIKEETYKADYNEKTYPLLYDRVTYEESIEAIKTIARFLRENNL